MCIYTLLHVYVYMYNSEIQVVRCCVRFAVLRYMTKMDLVRRYGLRKCGPLLIRILIKRDTKMVPTGVLEQ